MSLKDFRSLFRLIAIKLTRCLQNLNITKPDSKSAKHFNPAFNSIVLNYAKKEVLNIHANQHIINVFECFILISTVIGFLYHNVFVPRFQLDAYVKTEQHNYNLSHVIY